jgi:hypothetical protein
MRAHESTIVGVFDDRQQADRAVDELRRTGFRDDQIGVVMRHDAGNFAGDHATDVTDESRAGTGAVAGVLTGLGLGALAGLGVLSGVIPVMGPAIAGGTLGIILSNAAAGAGVGGLVGVLVGAGIPEDEAHYYQGEFEAGRTIVTVQAAERSAEAMTVLRRHGAYDTNTRPDYAASMKSRSDYAPDDSGAVANKPLDVPVRSEDVIKTGRVEDMDRDLEDVPDRGTGRTML